MGTRLIRYIFGRKIDKIMPAGHLTTFTDLSREKSKLSKCIYFLVICFTL